MLQGVSDIAALPDLTGATLYAHKLHDSLKLYHVSCSICVLLFILWVCPEVVVNVAVLALKSGVSPQLYPHPLTLTTPGSCNAAILKCYVPAGTRCAQCVQGNCS